MARLWSAPTVCGRPFAHSSLPRQACASPARPPGARCCRAQDLPAPFDAPLVGLWLGPRAHLVHYPVRGGADLNVVAVTEGGAALQGWNQTGSAETLLAGFTGWTKDSRSLLERAAAWRSWSLYGLTGLRRFSEGRIALLGDAAHPVLPYLAQGAALGHRRCRHAGGDDRRVARRPGAGLSPLRRTPLGRAPPRVQRLSRRFGRIYHFGGLLRLARNLVLERRSGAAALADLDWLYGTPR